VPALAHVIAKAIYDAADLTVVYTESITPSSYHLSQKPDASVLFLHPSASPLVEAARRDVASHLPPIRDIRSGGDGGRATASP
jgi:hypothetical protein